MKLELLPLSCDIKNKLDLLLLVPFLRLSLCFPRFKLRATRPAVHSKDMTAGYRQTSRGQHQAAGSDESN